MKKKTIWTYLKRILIAVIFVVVLSFVGIFMFDRYESTNSSFTNIYPNEYWDELKGFKKYEELISDEDKNNILSPKYESPYDEDDNIFDKINKSRYDEELELIVKPIRDKHTLLVTKLDSINNLSEKDKPTWILKVLGVSTYTTDKTMFEMVSSKYTGTEAEFYDMIVNYQDNDLFTTLNANGYSGDGTSFKGLVEAVASGKDSREYYEQAKTLSGNADLTFEQWVVDVCGFNNYITPSGFCAYDYVRLHGYSGLIDEWKDLLTKHGEIYATMIEFDYNNSINGAASDYDLYMAIYHDQGKVDLDGNVILKSAYDQAKEPDMKEVLELEHEIQQLGLIVDEADLRLESISEWKEYFSRYQLVLKNEDFEFWFSYGLTTFKIVDLNSGYEWYSNPKDVVPSLSYDQKTVISVLYGTSAGAEIPYSNYEYSVSTLTKQNRSVTPNYAVKVDTENNIVQVWYRFEKRGIDYTYFPKYVSQERITKLLANNKEYAAKGMTDSTGATIPDIEACNKAYEDAQTQIDKLKRQLAAGEITQTEHDKAVAPFTQIQKDNKIGRDAYTKWLYSYYDLITEDVNKLSDKPYYEWNGGSKFEDMSQIVINNLYKWLYEWCGYNKGDLAEDNTQFSVDIDIQIKAFEVAMEYKLTDTGLTLNIPGSSIREYGDSKLCKLDILPYFTSTPEGIGGYTLIPDGSGAILEHDNGKANLYDPYIKRFYSTDLSETSSTKKATSYDIMLPMYAVVNNVGNGSAACIIDIANMASQIELRATTAGFGTLGEYNNRNSLKAYIREGQSVYIGVYAKEEVRKFTNQLLTEDIIINYHFLSDTENKIDYSQIAKLYRQMLIERYNFTDENGVSYSLTEKDTTTSPVLEMDVIGAYTYKDNFLGIAYTAKDTMTTYEQLDKMVSDLKALNVTDADNNVLKSNIVKYINVYYHGWRKEALVNVTFKSIKLNSLLGSKEQLKAIAEQDNVTIYPYLSFGEVNDYQENFGGNHYTTRDVIGEIITKQQYALNTNTYDPKARTISIISPHYYYVFAQSLVDSYVKLFGSKAAQENKIGVNSISIDKFGSALAGDYKKNNEMFKTGAMREQIKSLQLVYNTVENLNLYQPYDYAFNYISHAKDIPYQSTQKEILDYSIPFYQLVVNGLFDYSGESINVNIEDGLDYHIMKMIETGSNPQFTFTYDSSAELVRTEYNSYYNTEYTNWFKEITRVFDELDTLGIYQGRLIRHERLAANVYLVTYLVNGSEVQIILNYSFASYMHQGSLKVPAKSYVKL